MEKMRAMVLSKCAPIETSPLKLLEIDRHQIKNQNEILIKIEACGFLITLREIGRAHV